MIDGVCKRCGAHGKIWRGICPRCEGARGFTPTTDYRHLLSPDALERLRESEAERIIERVHKERSRR